jgi:hypothetical protein
VQAGRTWANRSACARAAPPAAGITRSPDCPEWSAEMLSTLFEAARVHGTTIQVQAPARNLE